MQKMLEKNQIKEEAIFQFQTKTVKLNSGYEMPLNGIGTYSLTGETCYQAILNALNSGVRLIDTAYMYHNEEEIGKAIKASKVSREEIFVTTKLYLNQYDAPEAAIEEALRRLDLEYIDLMLLHHPGENDIKAYQAMEKYVKKGKIKSIGLSNWYIEELKEFLPHISIMPAVVQNEIHPFYQENDVIPYIQNLGIVVEGWYPFGGRGYTKELLNNEILIDISKQYNVSVAQVILRWNLQRGVVVIPGSSNLDHIKENTEIYHFELTEEDMQRIKALNRDEKHDWY
ncbi:MAG: aldo/keto reductase [Bacilli bacterium]|nr:aldo/keto reductase [Bacilli bacterium]